ncbi:MAG: monovalent cation/H(+) antiporter subunit G [Ectothiorhodospiraceae bacterium]|nr:monovalent cation/H(+) antiporter subunit G [Ectothiorhodospiraceae bacterium]MCH8504737.1 monovalent cation/H(+) antiporter subunit G [Ectothiorhodospiraceae bacterium]
MTLPGVALLLTGLLFYLAGTVGLLRFPDVYSRLHAITKADNVGLGLLCLGIALLSSSWGIAALLALVWLLAIGAATVGCHLIARHSLLERQRGRRE